MRVEDFGGREINSGRPIRRGLVGVEELPDCCRSSNDESWSSEDMTMYFDAALDGVMSFTVPENGSG